MNNRHVYILAAGLCLLGLALSAYMTIGTFMPVLIAPARRAALSV